MVREKSDGVIKVKVSLDKRVHDKIEKLAKDSGLSVAKFIAETVETLALDPTIRLLHDDPALAREVAVKALGDFLDGKGVRVIASSIGEVELTSDPEPPEPEPDPNAEAKALFGQIVNSLAPIAEQLGMELPTKGGNGKGPEPQSSEPVPKAQGRGRRARPAPPRNR